MISILPYTFAMTRFRRHCTEHVLRLFKKRHANNKNERRNARELLAEYFKCAKMERAYLRGDLG